jgi:SpoVK/Ycf46/Vps4 family AAA+-type ATPase
MTTRKLKKLNLKAKKKLSLDLAEISKLTVLEAIEKIVILSNDSKLSDSFIKEVTPYLQVVADKQGISNMQALFLSLFLERSTCSCKTDLSDVAEILDCRAVTILKYQTILDDLVRKQFIRMSHDYNDEIHYFVPKKVIMTISQNKKFEREPYKCDDAKKFLEKFFDLTHSLYEEEINHDIFHEELDQLFGENEDNPFVKSINKLRLNNNDRMLLTHFCRHLAIHNEAVLSADNLVFLLKEDHEKKWLTDTLELGKHIFQKRKLIEYDFDDGFEDRSNYRLTARAIKRLLKGFKLKTKDKPVASDIIISKHIEEKKLFYDGKTNIQVEELEGLLSEENFKNIRERMKSQKMRCGFACVFYGSPGTGKTETVLQIARKTGRNILQVNISEIKSCWVGESEKNIKGVFDRYREQVKRTKTTPILLFNEADAVIGKRREGAERAVDKMENSIQNIILQEMETLDGIMIATTNLEQNMDKAFERRFLYKIKFNKPSLEARSSIWKSMIPALSHDDCTLLASKYDFSGGQIENIARHFAINSVLHGEEKNKIDSLCEYCDGEKFEKKEYRKIGFV